MSPTPPPRSGSSHAHHAAVADVLDLFEREVAATRAGISDSDGAVAQVDVAGVAAVAYDHFDSRAGDPQLHTHVVVSNKVLTVMDGRWRSLDGRPVFASRTGLSAHYNALLADRLSRDLGIDWELRQRGADRNPQMGGRRGHRRPDHRVLEPHPRDRAQEGRAHRGVRRQARADAVGEDHRRAPRPGDARHAPAEGGPIARRPDRWLAAAGRRAVGDRAHGVVTDADRPRAASRLTVDDVPLAAIEAISADVVAAVAVKRAVWTHWNLMAEASKQTMDLRFATTEDREAVVGLVVDAAQSRSVALTPPELATQPGPVPARGRHEPCSGRGTR